MQISTLLSLGSLAVIVTCSAVAAPAPTLAPRYHGQTYINYTTIPGFFAQDDPKTNVSTFDYSATNFGLLNVTYPTNNEASASFTQWQRFDQFVFHLNRESGRFVQYKVLYMGRHGEGYHNVAETYYGTPAWNCYWSLLDGNATISWADARITPNGVAQAQKANAFWASHIISQKIPVPETYYTSPLTRCLQTANITFSGLDLPSRQAFIPTIKELFREGISGHTCDRRSNKTEIHAGFPKYKIEAGFSEEDLLWRKGVGEVSQDQDVRSKKVLDEVFGSDDSTYISITSHSGEIASILRVLGHQAFSLATGQVIPVLVRAEIIQAPPTPVTTLPWTTISTCATPPPLPAA